MAEKPSAKPGAEAGAEKKNGAAPAEAAASAKPGGFAVWAPLLANIVLMPALGFATFTFLIQPKLGQTAAAPAEHAEAKAEDGHGGGGEHGESSSGGGAHGGKGGAKGKVTVPLPGKILVNVAGTQGTRYLLANVALVSGKSDLKDLIEKYEPQLKDAASSALASKTIPELEKPGARNVIRSELISVFNNVLGDGTVTELYLTEFAIQ
ncbi:MAG TPA: flagellar basal body-associated FliL family protein [Verrucomicrobiae bacterium]